MCYSREVELFGLVFVITARRVVIYLAERVLVKMSGLDGYRYETFWCVTGTFNCIYSNDTLIVIVIFRDTVCHSIEEKGNITFPQTIRACAIYACIT